MAPQQAARAAGACGGCGAPIEVGQRYCVQCGERFGSRSPQLRVLLRRVVTPASARRGPTAPLGVAEAGSPARRPHGPLAAASARVAALRLPSPWVSALLVLGFLGFGVVLGAAAGSRAEDSLAAATRPPLKLVLPATGSSPTSGGASPAATEAPAAAAETTPEPAAESTPAPATSAPTSTPAKKPAAAGGNSGNAGKGEAQAPASASKLPAIKHVFVIMLSDEPYAATFGPESKAPYLASTLERRGELLPRYYAVAHQQLANEIALLSGQGPTPATAANCATYAPIASSHVGAEGQVLGEGCVYPSSTETLLGQLRAKQLPWRAYVQGIEEPPSAAVACGHPALGAIDPTSATPPPATPYATFRNPIVYFEGLTSAPSCAAQDVGLSALDEDLASAPRTPALAYIAPDRCHDGSPGPCPGGGPGGLAAADSFLETVVPKIVASKAYKDSGLLVITSDQAPSSGELADSSSCCGQPRFPNMPPPSGASAGLAPEGGGQVGALLLSPYVKAHAVSQEQYDHFSLLRTIEDLFELKHLGYAAGAKVPPFAPSLFTTTPAK